MLKFWWPERSAEQPIRWRAKEHDLENRPKDGTILRNNKTVSNDSGNHLNFDNGMQPYNT